MTNSMTAAERKAKQRRRAIQVGVCYVCLTTRAREHRAARCAAMMRMHSGLDGSINHRTVAFPSQKTVSWRPRR